MNSGGAMARRDWREVRDRVAARIAAGELAAGDRLPTEPELAGAFDVGRHSVRRAMAELALRGMVSVERGRGTFVRAQPPITYRVGRRTRWRENLRAQGLTPGSEHISDEVVPAPGNVATELGLAEGALVHRILKRGLADGRPISLALSFHCARRFPDLDARRAAGGSVTDIYRSHGVLDYRRRHTTVLARHAEPWEARLLAQRPEAPVMALQKTDVDPEGQPVGYAESVWSALLVRFRFEEGQDD